MSVSERTWDTLSEDHQAVLKGAFEAAGPQLTQIILGAENALLGNLTEAGVPVYTPTDDELAQWRDLSADVARDVAADMGEGGIAILDAIDAAKLACQG